MVENNFDLDLDEKIFSDDFLPNNDKISKVAEHIRAPNSRVKLPKEVDAVNLFKQPLTPRKVHGVSSNVPGACGGNEKRVVQRRFPGPAGLLPEIHDNFLNDTDNSFNKSNTNNNEIDDMLMCSQTSLSVFQEKPWIIMRADFNAQRNYTIDWIKSNATSKRLVNQKAPFLAAIIKSVEYTRLKLPTFTLKDPTDEIQADISHDLYEEHANDLTVGSVIVLKQFSVFSVKNETVHHLTITSNNLVAIYNKERQCKVNFGSRKLNCNSPSSSTRSVVNINKRADNNLDLDVLRNSIACKQNKTTKHENINAFRNEKERLCEVTDIEDTCESVMIPKIVELQKASPKLNSLSSLAPVSHNQREKVTSCRDDQGSVEATLEESKRKSPMFKFHPRASLPSKSSDLDEIDLNLSLDLFSQEVFADDADSIDSRLAKTCDEPHNKIEYKSRDKLVVDEVSPPLKKVKKSLSQKFRDFKFKPRDDAIQETNQCKEDLEEKKGNFIDCSQISIVSQNKEDHDILQDVFHNVDAESLFEDF